MTRFTLTTIAACAAIIAVTQALPIRASAEESRTDCIAMLDLITTCANQQAMTAGQSAMAARNTTGMNSEPRVTDRMDADTSSKEDKKALSSDDNIYGSAP